MPRTVTSTLAGIFSWNLTTVGFTDENVQAKSYTQGRSITEWACGLSWAHPEEFSAGPVC
jgi:hypothetical protein